MVTPIDALSANGPATLIFLPSARYTLSELLLLSELLFMIGDPEILNASSAK